MLVTFKNIFSRKKTLFTIVIVWIFTFFILRVVPVYEILKNSFRIPGLSLSRKMSIFFEYTISVFLDVSFLEQILSLGLALLTSINIILFIQYARRQKQILSGKSFFASVSGIVLGLFGVGCVSCGVLVLAPMISFIGLGAYIGGITEYALFISSGGLILVIISILYLLKKLSEPLVCD